VYRLYNPHDAQAIRRDLDEGTRNVVIVGGGLIGLEVCGAFRARGCNVVILEMLDQIVPGLLDRDMAVLLENYLLEQGVKLSLGNMVTQIIGDGSGKVKTVKTKDGVEYPAEMVIVAVGVRPNTSLAEEAGLELGATGAILVNEYLQTSDPNIYAGGDCVENYNLVSKEKCYMPLGSTANKHGRVIGDNIKGRRTKFPGITGTVVFKVLDFNVGKTGLTEGEAKRKGFETEIAIAPKQDCANYYPVSNPFILKLIADKKTGKVLGAQALGTGEAIKRIDVVATSLKFNATVKDLADLDLGYAPPYSTAIDALAHAGNIIRNKFEGLGHGIKPFELKRKMESGEDFILLDVRSPQECDDIPLKDERVVNIPLSQFRSRFNELPKSSEIVIFCRTSVRAYEAERILRGEGYSDVKFLDGSLDAWPYPI
jgi:NADPH-dependent 2,4-dienoyl-CoA reductase/sulfur reductase-like enzyme/rhodanese-related sulfurtransferase